MRVWWGRERRFAYFVSFTFSNAGRVGSANGEWFSSKPITRWEQVEDFEASIDRETGNTWTCVTHFQLLRVEGAE